MTFPFVTLLAPALQSSQSSTPVASADRAGQVLARLQLVDLAGSECAGEQGLEDLSQMNATSAKGNPVEVESEPTQKAMLDPCYLPMARSSVLSAVVCAERNRYQQLTNWRTHLNDGVGHMVIPKNAPCLPGACPTNMLTAGYSPNSPAVSGVTGLALKETSFINRSLAALADVLGALSEHCDHIPYRNSKLTHLLQDSIGLSS